MLEKGGSWYTTIAPSTASDGFFSWTIPVSIAAATDYKVKIVSVNNWQTVDRSNNFFTISAQRNTQPNNESDIIKIIPFIDIDWQSMVKLYPNPTKGKLFMEFTNELLGEKVKLSLMTTSGMMMIEKDFYIDGTESIDMGWLETGFYIIIIRNDKGFFREKVLRLN